MKKKKNMPPLGKYAQPALQEECIPHFIHIGRNFFTYNTEYEKNS